MREKTNLKHNMKKEGIIMKSKRTTEKKEKICNILPGILALTMITLLCIPQMVSTTHAQSTSSNVGWHGAMAMGNLAENENRTEDQYVSTNSNEIITTANIEVTNDVKKTHKKTGLERE
jgi:hypothetical protein